MILNRRYAYHQLDCIMPPHTHAQCDNIAFKKEKEKEKRSFIPGNVQPGVPVATQHGHKRSQPQKSLFRYFFDAASSRMKDKEMAV